MPEVPPDTPEADVQEQARDWKDNEDSRPKEIPPDAPEADVLDQERAADLDDEDRGHD